jgi:hypothetical protein
MARALLTAIVLFGLVASADEPPPVKAPDLHFRVSEDGKSVAVFDQPGHPIGVFREHEYIDPPFHDWSITPIHRDRLVIWNGKTRQTFEYRHKPAQTRPASRPIV